MLAASTLYVKKCEFINYRSNCLEDKEYFNINKITKVKDNISFQLQIIKEKGKPSNFLLLEIHMMLKNIALSNYFETYILSFIKNLVAFLCTNHPNHHLSHTDAHLAHTKVN